jgi:hypothetical protein
MAKAVGVNGAVSFITGHAATFDRFDFTQGQRLINTTGFGDTFESNTAGLKFSRFSAEGTPKYNVSSSAPGYGTTMSQTGGTLTYTVATGCTVSVTGILTDINVRSDVNGEARLTFNGVGDGAVTQVWDETP